MPYFDYNATSPLRDCARAAWLKASAESWANPSAIYPSAQRARHALERSRMALATILGCRAERIVFTSGATECNNTVLHHYASKGASCAVSAVEHQSVLVPAKALFGERLIVMPVDESGRLDIAEAERLIHTHRPALVSLMAANSETGVVQPVEELSRICRAEHVHMHCDAVQLLGRLPLNHLLDRCDFFSFSAHKIGGPRGVGVLVIPHKWTERMGLFLGGPQERYQRAGTENLAGAEALVATFSEAVMEVAHGRMLRQAAFKASFEARMEQLGARIIGRGAERLPNTSLFIMPRHQGLRWVTRMATKGFEIATGSACGSEQEQPSHVLSAMGIDVAGAKQVLRVSSGASVDEAEWIALADALAKAQTELDAEENVDAFGVILP